MNNNQICHLNKWYSKLLLRWVDHRWYKIQPPVKYTLIIPQVYVIPVAVWCARRWVRKRQRMHAGDGFNFNLSQTAKQTTPKRHISARIIRAPRLARTRRRQAAPRATNFPSRHPRIMRAAADLPAGECSAVLLIQSRLIICSLWSDKLPSQGGYLIFTLAGPAPWQNNLASRSWCSPACGIRKNLYTPQRHFSKQFNSGSSDASVERFAKYTL